MGEHAEKFQENKSQLAANAVLQKQSRVGSTFQFVDNRPEAIARRKLQQKANNSSTQNQKPIQKKENNTSIPDNIKSGIENRLLSSSFSGSSIIQRKIELDDLTIRLIKLKYDNITTEDINTANTEEINSLDELYKVLTALSKEKKNEKPKEGISSEKSATELPKIESEFSRLLSTMNLGGLRKDLRKGEKGKQIQVSGSSTSIFFEVTSSLGTVLIKRSKNQTKGINETQMLEFFSTALATHLGMRTIKTNAIQKEGYTELRMEIAQLKPLQSNKPKNMKKLYFDLGCVFVFDTVINNYDRIAITDDTQGKASNLFIGSPSALNPESEENEGLIIADNEPSFEGSKSFKPAKEKIEKLLNTEAITAHIAKWLDNNIKLKASDNEQTIIQEGVIEGIRRVKILAAKNSITALFDYIMGEHHPSEKLQKYRAHLAEVENELKK